MKILHIINNLGGGGAEKLIADIVPSKRGLGHEVEVLLLQSEGGVYNKSLEEEGVRITYLSFNSRYSILFTFKIRNYINNGKFDIVNVHTFPSLYYVGLSSFIGLKNGVQLVYTEHSTNNRRRNSRIFKFLDRIIYKHYVKVIAISRAAKTTLLKHLDCNSGFITVINNGIDLDVFKNAPRLDLNELIDGYDARHKVICMVGRFNKAKDQATLIEAISLLPKDFKLLLVGDVSPEDNCIALVKELNVFDRVYFVGFRQDIPKILKACDIGVLSSNWEGMPLSALEIFASEIPFIGSKVQGIKELFEDQKVENILFKHKDSHALSLLIKKIMKDKTARDENKRICKKIVSKYTLESMTDSYLELYRDLLKI